MGNGDLVFFAIIALLVGLIASHYFSLKKHRCYPGSDDNGSQMRPERNDDGQGGGSID